MAQRHETKQYWRERAQRAEREATLNAYGVACALHGKPVAVERWRGESDADDRYTARLYHPSAPHGGILLLTFEYPGQRPHTSVYYFDTWKEDALRQASLTVQFKMATAIERLRSAARLACEPAIQQTA